AFKGNAPSVAQLCGTATLAPTPDSPSALRTSARSQADVCVGVTETCTPADPLGENSTSTVSSATNRAVSLHRAAEMDDLPVPLAPTKAKADGPTETALPWSVALPWACLARAPRVLVRSFSIARGSASSNESKCDSMPARAVRIPSEGNSAIS